MPQFQKFQFDNFIIDDEEASAVFEENQEPETVMEEPVPEPVGEDVIEPVDVSFEEIEPEPETEPEPLFEPAPTFSEEEVSRKEKLAEEKGVERGRQEAREETECRNTALLENINDRLTVLAADMQERQKEADNQVLDMVSTALHKLLPSLAKEQAQEIVGRFLTENFPNFKNEPKLSFYFNAENIPWVQEKIARLAAVNDFEGKIALHKDNSLAPCDCRIEWENGGVERKMNKMLEKVDNLLEEAGHKN